MSAWSARISGQVRAKLRRAAHDKALGICWLCGKPATLADGDLDHVRAVALGGDLTDPTNHRWSHASCNRARKTGARDGRSQPTSRAW